MPPSRTAVLPDPRPILPPIRGAGPPAEGSRISESLTEQLRTTTSELVVRRTRAGLGLVVLSIAVFALGDLGADPERRSLLFAIKAIQLAYLALLFYCLRQPRATERAVPIALCGVAGVCVTTAASAVISQDAVTAPLLSLILTMGASALIPWGVPAQIACAVIAGTTTLANLSQVGAVEIALGRPGIAFVVAFAASVYTAFELQRYWTAVVRRNLELQQEKGFSERVIDSTVDGIYAFDRECRCTVWNPAMERISGIGRERALGRRAGDVCPFLKGSLEELHYRKVLRGEASRAGERPYTIPENGRKGFFTSRYSPLRNERGEVVGGLAVITDVTEHRQAEEALRESEERYRSVAETAPVAILTADAAGLVVSVNAVGERLFGYAAEELIGQPLTRLVPDPFQDAQHGELDRFVQAGRPHVFGRTVEMTGRRKDGKEFPVELSVSLWKTSQGIIFFTGILQDITEKKGAEKLRRDLVAMLSHDLKNPLTAILGFTELLRDLPGDDTQRDEFLARIEANARTAVNLAVNFVDASEIDSRTIQAKLEPISLNQAVESVLRQQESGARVKQIQLELSIDDSVGQVPLDRRMIDRVIANLVTNAIKFSPPRSRVLVETGRRNGSVGLRVLDQGPGIPAGQRSRLFERFSRFGDGRPDSSGLGLFIVKTLVDAQGGSVSADFPAAGGSVFEVWFPSERDRVRPG